MTSWTSGMVGLAALVTELGVSKFLGPVYVTYWVVHILCTGLKRDGQLHSSRVESYLR